MKPSILVATYKRICAFGRLAISGLRFSGLCAGTGALYCKSDCSISYRIARTFNPKQCGVDRRQEDLRRPLVRKCKSVAHEVRPAASYTTSWDTIRECHTSNFFSRFAVGFGFLSAVADRFGLWGPPGSVHAVWGDYDHFIAYTAHLNPFAPAFTIPILAGVSTSLEILFGLALVIGFRTRLMAWGSAALLAAFALAMTVALGVKAPLDYSVFAACAAALMIAMVPRYRWSVDDIMRTRHAPEGDRVEI